MDWETPLWCVFYIIQVHTNHTHFTNKWSPHNALHHTHSIIHHHSHITVGLLRLWSSNNTTPTTPLAASPLAHTATLLLLSLLHHTTIPRADPHPMQHTLRMLRDADEESDTTQEVGLVTGGSMTGGQVVGGQVVGGQVYAVVDTEAGLGGMDGPCVSFSGLYDALSVTCTEAPSTMLLYSLLRVSTAFREYLLV